MNFGIAITNDYLRKFNPGLYVNKELTAHDRSKVAMEQMDVSVKDAVQRLEQLKREYGIGVTTLCRIYNASGDRIRVKFDHSWRGYFYKDSPLSTVENGQWTTFVHVHPTYQPWGNAGAVIYGTAVDTDIFLGWQNPFHPGYNPACWAEGNENKNEKGKENWWDANSRANMLHLLDYKANNRCVVEGKDYTVNIQIGNTTTSFLVAVIQKA